MLKRRFLSKKHFFTAKVEGKRGRLTNDKKINVGKKNIEKNIDATRIILKTGMSWENV
jgi:hypothetical protein